MYFYSLSNCLISHQLSLNKSFILFPSREKAGGLASMAVPLLLHTPLRIDVATSDVSAEVNGRLFTSAHLWWWPSLPPWPRGKVLSTLG